MKAISIFSIFLSLSLGHAGQSGSPRLYSLQKSPELTRADLYSIPTVPNPRAALVLCPGMNGNGRGLLTPAWVDFARQHRLGLVALSFASSDEDLGNARGYYHPDRGAGKVLLDGIRGIYGHDLPVLLYGMSGGAHFTAGFMEWKPDRVISWCAYTAGWWNQPQPSKFNPPGIVACGDEDFRYGASLGYFLQGRAIGKPWTWVSLEKTGHQPSAILDDFVRNYFAAILERKATSPIWRDVDLKSPINDANVTSRPTLACWLPNPDVALSWVKVHQP
jgi:hypothetical protein